MLLISVHVWVVTTLEGRPISVERLCGGKLIKAFCDRVMQTISNCRASSGRITVRFWYRKGPFPTLFFGAKGARGGTVLLSGFFGLAARRCPKNEGKRRGFLGHLKGHQPVQNQSDPFCS